MANSFSISALAALRATVGIAAFVAPHRMTAGIDGADDRRGSRAFMTRMFGARDVAFAAGLAVTDGDARRAWIAIGVATDVADAAAATLSLRGPGAGHPVPPAAVALTVAGLGVAALRTN